MESEHLYTVTNTYGKTITFAWADVLALGWKAGPHSLILVTFRGHTADLEVLDQPQSKYEEMCRCWHEWQARLR